MKKLKLIAVAVAMLVAVCVPFAAGCPKPKDPNHVVVATNAKFQPMEFLDEKQNIVGFDIDLFNAIAQEAGLTVEFIDQPWDGIIEGLQTGRYDAIISSMTITDERKKVIDFSTPYHTAGLVVAVTENNAEIKSIDDLKGKRVAVERGTTGAKLASEIADVKLSEFPSFNDAFLDLKNGNVDAVINDAPVTALFIAEQGGVKTVGDLLTSEQYGIAVQKGNAALLQRLNDALAKLESSGKLAELKKKWHID